MPQLVKGGKYVYGWSTVSEDGRIAIPSEAVDEYGFSPEEPLMLIKGSRTSGGFGLTGSRLLEGTPMAGVKGIPVAPPATQPEIYGDAQPATGEPGGHDSAALGFTLPADAMEMFGIQPGTRLLLVRGSGRALGFLLRGPIYEEALKHSYLSEYG